MKKFQSLLECPYSRRIVQFFNYEFSLFYTSIIVSVFFVLCSSRRSLRIHSSILWGLTIVTWTMPTNEWNPHTDQVSHVMRCYALWCNRICVVYICVVASLKETENKFYECPDITMSIVITLSFMLWLPNFNTCLSLIALSDFCLVFALVVDWIFNVINCVILCQMDEQ